MTVRKAEKNPVAGVRTFFVPSDDPKKPEVEYVVVEVKRDGTQYYCQCSDFFFRRLPFIHTNLFAHCKHTAAVIAAIEGAK